MKLQLKSFGYIWGKEDISPEARKVFAISFTIIACLFGIFYTKSNFWISEQTVIISPGWAGGMCALFIYGALAARNYLPRPYSFQNIIFFIADVYLFGLIARYILGEGDIERTITITIFFGLIFLLWVGMKQVLGFVVLAFFILLIYKIFQIEQALAWRAFPFIVSAFLGISFQSENFFDDFKDLSSSFIKAPEIDRELIKESIEISGNQLIRAGKSATMLAVKSQTGGI